MIVVGVGETLDIGTTWIDPTTSVTVSGSVISGGSSELVYMPGLFTVSNVVVNSGGYEFVEHSGTAVDTIISSGGSGFVNFGGVVVGTTVR